jgi:hypothetical protein
MMGIGVAFAVLWGGAGLLIGAFQNVDVVANLFKLLGGTMVNASQSGVLSSGPLDPTFTQPNSASNPTANSNGSLPGGSYPGLVQPGSPGSSTNPIIGS